MKTLLPGVDCSDSSIRKFNLSDKLDSAEIVMFVPNAHNGTGGVFRITFNALLKFQFETVGIGEPETWIELIDAYLLEEEEWSRWKERLRLLNTGDSFGNLPPPSRFGNDQVFHVVLEAVLLRGIDRSMKLDGIEIVCRHIQIEDVTRDWDVSALGRPYRIPGAGPTDQS